MEGIVEVFEEVIAGEAYVSIEVVDQGWTVMIEGIWYLGPEDWTVAKIFMPGDSNEYVRFYAEGYEDDYIDTALKEFTLKDRILDMPVHKWRWE